MSERLNCIIVDDEEGAHLVIEHFLRGIGSLNFCKSLYNAVEAMDFVYSNRVDVMFLDINMPGLSGMEMLEAMSNPPLVVLTTAYAEFALESYKYQVVDYLVKPIEFPRFVAAVDKILLRRQQFSSMAVNNAAQPTELSHLFLKNDGNYIKVSFDDILYVRSWGNYIKVHTDKSTYISPMTTSQIEQKLDKARFKRIHKSYIVSLDKIDRISGGRVMLKDVSLPIGNTYRRELIEYFR